MTKNIRHNTPNTRLGFITSMARDDFAVKQKDSRSVLVKTGFLSRFVLVSYRYTEETAVKVARAISRGVEPEPIQLKFPLAKADVAVAPDRVLSFFPDAREDDTSRGLDPNWADAVTRSKQVDTNLLPRRIKQYRSLLLSIALSNGRLEVNDDDVRELGRLQPWLNTEFNPL
jgi:hypothetical protein